MNDPSPTSLCIPDPAAAVRLPRALERAGLWTIGAVSGVATFALLVFAVATQSSTDAERIAGTGDYAAGLVAALATTQARGGR